MQSNERFVKKNHSPDDLALAEQDAHCTHDFACIVYVHSNSTYSYKPHSMGHTYWYLRCNNGGGFGDCGAARMVE